MSKQREEWTRASRDSGASGGHRGEKKGKIVLRGDTGLPVDPISITSTYLNKKPSVNILIMFAPLGLPGEGKPSMTETCASYWWSGRRERTKGASFKTNNHRIFAEKEQFKKKNQDKNIESLIGGAPLVAQTVKNPPQWTRPRVSPWVRKIPWRREWQSTPVSLPGESHGQRL